MNTWKTALLSGLLLAVLFGFPPQAGQGAGGDEEPAGDLFAGYTDIGPDAYKALQTLVAEDCKAFITEVDRIMRSRNDDPKKDDRDLDAAYNALDAKWQEAWSAAAEAAQKYMGKTWPGKLPDDWAAWQSANGWVLTNIAWMGDQTLALKNNAIRDMWIMEDNAENDQLRIAQITVDVEYSHNVIQELIEYALLKDGAPVMIPKKKAQAWKDSLNNQVRPRVDNSAKVLSNMKTDVDNWFKNTRRNPDHIDQEVTRIFRTLWIPYNAGYKLAEPMFTQPVEQSWLPHIKKVAGEYREAYKKYEKACEKLRKEELFESFVTWKGIPYAEMPKVVANSLSALESSTDSK